MGRYSYDYGDGDGVNYGPVISLDVVGHEITHGVTEYSANLAYSYESGALNESFSDIFGESIEKFATGTNDWLMGADLGTPFRSMSNPKDYYQPDTYKGSGWSTGSSDNGGVHTNSGVQNHWFYLLSVGGSGSNDNGNSYNFSGIGMTKAYKIAYRNLTVYLSSNSDYYDARSGAIQAARDLYGNDSNEEAAVTNAWYAVGVGNSYDVGSTPPPSGDCTSGDIYLSITFDNYPEETGWNLKNSAGTVIDSQDYSSSNADGSTVTKTFSGLTTGDYTFTITDKYGDGFCCSYGSGSYTLSNDEGTLMTGGDFGSSESTGFCIEDGGGSGNDTQAPTAPTNLSASNLTQTTVDLSWNAATDNVGVTEYAVYQGGSLLGSTANTSAQITGLSDNSSYTFSVKAKDAAGNTSGSSNSVSVQTGGGSSNNNYCDSSGNNATNEWIDLVRLNNLNHSSSSDGGYADNTNLSANVPYGSNTIYISAGFYGYGYTEYWKVWIDFNQDGTFSSNEVIASGSSSSSNTLQETFNVSNSAIAGNTRMRVSMKYGSLQGSCDNFNYGEVEDYTVNIGQSNMNFGTDSQLSAEDLGHEGAVYGVNIYPNPVKGSFLNVSSNDNRDITYQVYDLLGKMVKQGELSGQAINVNRLSSVFIC